MPEKMSSPSEADRERGLGQRAATWQAAMLREQPGRAHQPDTPNEGLFHRNDWCKNRRGWRPPTFDDVLRPDDENHPRDLIAILQRITARTDKGNPKAHASDGMFRRPVARAANMAT